METEERGITFALGIKLFLDENKIYARTAVHNVKMPTEIILAQLRSLVKMFEEDYYSEFKNSITYIKPQ